MREWPLRSRRTDVCWYAAILPTRKIFCLLQNRFLPYGEAVTFSRRKRFCARGADFVPTGTTKSRLATKRRFERFPSGEAESHLELRIKIDIAFFPFKRAMNQYRHRVFPFQTRDFAKPAPGETSRVKKTQIPDRFSDERAISVRSWLFQRVSVGASRPMSDGRFESVCPW